jgi:hypothetical protein
VNGKAVHGKASLVPVDNEQSEKNDEEFPF